MAQTLEDRRKLEEKIRAEFRTAPVDPRFATTQNQSKYCWTVYNEALVCMRQKGENDEECKEIYQWAVDLCPSKHLEQWREHRRKGSFHGVQQPIAKWEPIYDEDEEDEDEDEDEDEESEGSDSEDDDE